MRLDEVDLLDIDAFQRGDHHEMFRVLRAEDPVHWQDEPDGPGFWSVTRLEDLVTVNRDTELFSSHVGGTNIPEMPPEHLEQIQHLMLNMDPPQHTRYRLLVNRGFTPKMIGALEGELRRRAQSIVANVADRGSCDFVEDVAAELPLQAIADLMGVPQEERRILFDLSNRLVGFDDPEFREGELGQTADDNMTAAIEMYAYAESLAAQRREDPQDDLVTKLINSEVEGERLSDFEFDMFFMLLAVAGNETTRNATAWGMRALIEHPEERAKLRANPDLLDSAIEEILRWATPVLHFRRTATRDTELGGRKIAAGDKVVIWHISANRDESVFEDPFRFDVARSPNDHIAFGGGGPHFCLGANLARLELRLIFRELLDQLPDLEFDGPVETLRSNFLGGIKRMPVRWPA